MKRSLRTKIVWLSGIVTVWSASGDARAAIVSLFDPGFESYVVSPGGYVKPGIGTWTFTNDAGVVEPISWSATRPAFEGSQYASTYAGTDRISQSVSFDDPGWYQLSVKAFAPGGTLTIPGVFTNGALVDGQFQFVFDNAAYGPMITVPMGQDWTAYSTFVNVSAAGLYRIGVDNALSDRYFINYDDFSVVSVPEPSAVFGLGGVVLMALYRRVRF
jgi:hypothetical protein